MTVLLVMLLIPGSASGRVIKSGSIMAPGQSGFVPLTGLATGTGSAHLTDQIGPFLRFGFKDASLNQPGVGAPVSPRAGVKIIRDAFGVPSITGQSMNDVWFGAGYAVAEDRLFQLELFRRATTGRLAEVLGKSYLERDVATRRDYYTNPELRDQLRRLTPELQERFSAYATGINAWIARTRSDPSLLPGEFAAIGTTPADFDPLELVAIGAYLARTTPTDVDTELRNARAVKALGPKTFNRFLPLRSPGGYSTVPRRSGLFPAQPGRSRRHERRALIRSSRFLAGLRLPASDPTAPISTPATPARMPDRAGDGRPGSPQLRTLTVHGPSLRGSNAWAMRGPGQTATLFNGPQLEWEIPEQVVELEVHGPGLDVRGMTAAGVPVLVFGHNKHLAFGVTSGYSDEDDLYVERLIGAETYRFRGEVRRMSCRNETFSYRPPLSAFIPSTSRLGQVPDASVGTQTRRLCRTVHGPVETRAGGLAFARRYAPWGREVETLAGFAALEQASTVEEAAKAAARMTWNENLLAADDRGNIGFWHPGLLPIKPRTWDERLPYPGTGEAEWRGLLPWRQHPQVINPRQGYLVQWNNRPSAGWTSGGTSPRPLGNGGFHRARFLAGVVAGQQRAGAGFEQAVAANRNAATVVQQRPLADTRLRRARAQATGAARTILTVLVDWDGSYDRTDSNGTVEPGVAAWDAFKNAAWRLVFSRFDHKALSQIESGRGATHLFDATNLEAYALRTLGPAGYRQAAADALTELQRRFGSSDPGQWREPRTMYQPASTGAASWDPFPFYDRGTVESLTHLGP